MKIKLTRNLGGKDAAKLSLDYTTCLEGEVVDVKEAVANTLIERGLALPEVIEGKPKATEVKGK